MLDWLRDTYGLVLTVAMRHRPFVIVILIAVGAASGLLLKVVGTDFFPTAGRGHHEAALPRTAGHAHRGDREDRAARRGGDPQGHPGRARLDRINDQIGVPLFFNLVFVPTDNISGMDAEILILLKKPHRPVADYMREIRAKIPPKFPGSSFYFQNADIVTQVLNFGLPAPIDVQVQDSNFERAQKYAALVARRDRRGARRGRRAADAGARTIRRCGWTWTACARRGWGSRSATSPPAC